ncbi:MAG: thioredoxin [Oscillospiraceae bacterium]|nr:thioredoxin [Oscillospiraceae bacterium]
MALMHFDENSFKANLGKPGLLVVDFWADWCGPCKMLGPVIEQLAKDFDGRATVGKINVDDEPELAQKYQISSIPAVLLFKNGTCVDKLIGVQPPENFTKAIERNL